MMEKHLQAPGLSSEAGLGALSSWVFGLFYEEDCFYLMLQEGNIHFKVYFNSNEKEIILVSQAGFLCSC